MANIPPRHNNDLFLSVISEIKKYTGKDPLLPWLRGIKKIRLSLSPELLKERLPRFLQKCAQTFQADPKYHNDLRYVRVWIQLMDFVDDPRTLLKTMEMNRIGMKQALFYQAYALYFVKLKKFEEADNMFHLGVHNLAEPVGELQKSYEQFLRHMEQYKKKRTRRQEARAAMFARSSHSSGIEYEETKLDSGRGDGVPTKTGCREILSHNNYEAKKLDEKESAKLQRRMSDSITHLSSNDLGTPLNSPIIGTEGEVGIVAGGPSCSSKQLESMDIEPDKPNRISNDETVVFKFVDTAIVGKSEAEDACHHGLVDPTINMKEAMNAISNMFWEPMELEALHRRNLHEAQPKAINQRMSSGFDVFLDEDVDNGMGLSSDQNKENAVPPSSSGYINPTNPSVSRSHENETQSPPQELFKVFSDDEYDSDCGADIDDNSHQNAFVFPRQNLPTNESDDSDARSSPIMKFREDTVVGRFVGTAILDEPEVENACHHGLVEPTINLKEAMDAINSMFGKPLDFVKTNRSKNPGKMAEKKRSCGGFSILADEEKETQHPPQGETYSSKKLDSECGLFELTMNTKKALDDINEMFGMPLDF